MYFAGQQTHSPRQSWLLRGACLALFMLISACGFTLRGVTPLPFDTLYLGIADNTQFGADVRRALRAASPDTKLVTSPKDAQAILQEVSNTRALREVSLNAQGRVEEYELGINYTFRLIDAKGRALIPDTTLSIYREMPYDDQIVQAKQGQIETLYIAMQRDLVSRLLRRMTAPEVRKAFENREQRGEDGETPLYDPTAPTPRSTPAPWQTPSTTDPANLR
ncbi:MULTISPECIES: LPS assembly lipoprotein LptE [Achromobacter]|uniref:LPS-assembly lipoprotein LptE n=1 Tax=Achromobacter TaxID=222 RepID=UPI0006C28BFE|nr:MULTISPECIES: LPS assembly lipoprotein LptE [Achromobacter]CUI27419.1 Lipopolysaccharide-assembly [Achromobacter sp. 2789STDY5608621]CUK13632.1 Lipopolysaccharide-assembly [Achromobacter sp. 2789STDY5608615]